MNTREGLDWIALVSIFGILLILIVITSLALQGILSLEGFVVGGGTFLLAMATFYLAYAERAESISNRIQDKELAEKDRTRIWLKNRLDEFYGPLFGNLTTFHVGDREMTKREFIDPFLNKYSIRDKYNYLASNRLKELLDRYFSFAEADIRMERGKTDDEWKALLDEIKASITEDFKVLKQRYYELVGPPARAR